VRIKICGLSRAEDIDYVNEAGADYAGLVFAQSRRRVSPAQAERLRGRLAGGIVPVGVFAGAPPQAVAALYRDGVIAMAQLHGAEDAGYIARLKEASSAGGLAPVPVIKAVFAADLERGAGFAAGADFYLADSGAGSGEAFDWGLLRGLAFPAPWFLAGGICAGNAERAMGLGPFAIDVSSGVETGGVKDFGKIMRLAAMAAAAGGKAL